MAIRIKLGDYQTVDDDPLGRGYVGCFPRMTEAEAWEAGRGVWKMNRTRANSERFALIVGQDKVIAAAQVKGVNQYEDRIALQGSLVRRAASTRAGAMPAAPRPRSWCDPAGVAPVLVTRSPGGARRGRGRPGGRGGGRLPRRRGRSRGSSCDGCAGEIPGCG
jgi:hypothetical protein